jgi:hypothetical protein
MDRAASARRQDFERLISAEEPFALKVNKAHL